MAIKDSLNLVYLSLININSMYFVRAYFSIMFSNLITFKCLI
ncbi:hypothetical protein BVAVS116_H0021 (plasmid) [Borreliella valaisiana VS116]|uniref:Uncharacterized protein n=1 Tax=Borreliella valaisiana VS116 TaxID=445987 RepID=C0R978_BORVA|nr:hypothetical protein BVAVS116_H0021 [Borreliella valaisiana VS116]